MRHVASAAVALGAAFTLDCSSAQFNQLNVALAQAQVGEATRLATSATIAQMALIHMAAALSLAASQDMNDGNVPPLAGTPRSDADFTYELDSETSTAKVLRTRDGKRTVDLTFTFESERGNAGMAYSITRTAGHFEGYQLLFPRCTLLYSAVLGDNFLPQKHTNGNFLFNVDIAAAGSLGANGNETVRISKANFSLVYPILDSEAKVGEITVVSPEGSSFDGEIIMASKSLKLQGTVKTSNGGQVFDLKTNSSGELSLSKSIQPVPASAMPGMGPTEAHSKNIVETK